MRAFIASTGIFLLASGNSPATSAGHRVFAMKTRRVAL